MRQVHHTKVELAAPLPESVAARATITLKVRVSCSAGCDLRGRPVQVVDPNGVVVTGDLVTNQQTINETDDLSFTVPSELGTYSWAIRVPAHETDEIAHESASMAISFSTVPHATSVAVWGVPVPTVVDRPFTVKVGLQCCVGCHLAGQRFTVRDTAAGTVSTGTLCADPWPGTSALYWADVEFSAPATEGVYFRSVACDLVGCDLPHQTATVTFSFRAAGRPEHTVVVRVVDANTHAPIDEAEVRLGVYLASTDARGTAQVQVPTGVYELTIRKDGYTADPVTVTVGEDIAVDVGALAGTSRAQWEEKLTTLEDYPWG